MICVKCGASNVSSAQFCATCGANLRLQAANNYEDGFSRGDAPSQNDYSGQSQQQSYQYGYQQGYDQNQYGYQQGYDQNQYGYQQGYVQNQYGSQQGYGQNQYDYGQAYSQNSYQQGYSQPQYGYQQSYNRGPRVGGNSSTKNVVGWIISIFAGLMAVVSIAMVFIPSISLGDKTTATASANASSVLSYLNADKLKELLTEEEAAKKEGRDYSYNQNFIEFAVQNFNTRYNSEDAKKVKAEIEKYNQGKAANEKNQTAMDSLDYLIRGLITLGIFIIPLIFLIIGAIVSFMRKPGAAGLLMTGGIILLAASIYWVLFIQNAAPLGRVFINGAYSNSGDYYVKVGKIMTAAPVLMIVFSSLTILGAVGQIVFDKVKDKM